LAENISILHQASKEEKYILLIPQIKALVADEKDLIANLGNIAAALKTVFNFLWVGFYIVKGDDLVLGPFQGPVACTRIKPTKGVCGQARAQKQIIRVENVDLFPGHIACSSSAKSEIVIPALKKNNDVFLVLDVDSESLAYFDHVDQKYLQEITHIIEDLYQEYGFDNRQY
jgi:L-methionine (R)-S-oxide reductase